MLIKTLSIKKFEVCEEIAKLAYPHIIEKGKIYKNDSLPCESDDYGLCNMVLPDFGGGRFVR